MIITIRIDELHIIGLNKQKPLNIANTKKMLIKTIFAIKQKQKRLKYENYLNTEYIAYNKRTIKIAKY